MMSRVLQFGSSSFTAAALVLFGLGLAQATPPAKAGPPPVLTQCGTPPSDCNDLKKCNVDTETCEVGTASCPCKLNGPK